MNNVNMKLPDINRVGVIVPPDSFYKPVMWDNRAADRMFVQDYTDIFIGTKAAKPPKKFGTVVIK